MTFETFVSMQHNDLKPLHGQHMTGWNFGNYILPTKVRTVFWGDITRYLGFLWKSAEIGHHLFCDVSGGSRRASKRILLVIVLLN